MFNQYCQIAKKGKQATFKVDLCMHHNFLSEKKSQWSSIKPVKIPCQFNLQNEPHGSLSILKSCWISTWGILCVAPDFKQFIWIDTVTS